MGGIVDVHAYVKIHACLGRRLTQSVGRLTVLHVVVDDARRMTSHQLRLKSTLGL